MKWLNKPMLFYQLFEFWYIKFIDYKKHHQTKISILNNWL